MGDDAHPRAEVDAADHPVVRVAEDGKGDRRVDGEFGVEQGLGHGLGGQTTFFEHGVSPRADDAGDPQLAGRAQSDTASQSTVRDPLVGFQFLGFRSVAQAGGELQLVEQLPVDLAEHRQRGVAVAKSEDDVKTIAGNLLGGTLVTIQTGAAGKLVNKILVAQDVYYPGPNEVKEFYLSILLDRAKGMNVVMYSTEGGMDIEEVAHNTPEKIFKEWVHPGGGLQGFQARKIAFNLGLSGDAFKSCVKFVTNLYNAYVGLDCAKIGRAHV